MPPQTTREHTKHNNFVVLGVVIVVVFFIARDETQRSLHANSVSVEAISRLVGVTPLSSRDLLGLTVRPIRHDWNDLIDQYAVWLRVSGSYDNRPQPGALIQSNLLLLSGQSERFLNLQQSEPSDDLSLYLLAIGYGQKHQLNRVEEVLKRLPSGRQVLSNIGHRAWDNRINPDAELAIAAMEMALRLNDTAITFDQSGQYRILSNAYEYLGMRSQATEFAVLWVLAEPSDCAANSMLAALRLRSRDIDNAMSVLQTWQRSGGDRCDDFPGRMGQLYDQQGDLELAIPLYREAVSRNLDKPYANWYLGRALFLHGDVDASIPYLEVALKSSYLDLQLAACELLSKISRCNKNTP